MSFIRLSQAGTSKEGRKDPEVLYIIRHLLVWHFLIVDLRDQVFRNGEHYYLAFAPVLHVRDGPVLYFMEYVAVLLADDVSDIPIILIDSRFVIHTRADLCLHDQRRAVDGRFHKIAVLHLD